MEAEALRLRAVVERAAEAAVERAAARRAAERRPALWRPPLVGFADARDPAFAELRSVAVDDHLFPADLLLSARSAVAFFVPFVRAVGASNSGGEEASDLWAEAYVETNALISRAAEAVAEALETEGFRSASVRATHNFDEERLVSRWSHRHVARIAGLGEFGLNNMLITAKGAAGRFGSLATDADLASPRGVKALTPHPCLFKRSGACGACVRACPTGALRFDGFDRALCYAACLRNARRRGGPDIADVCGKCVAALPCSYRE